jgi:hypothetical protein
MNRMNRMNKPVFLFNIQIRIDLDKDEGFIKILLSNENNYHDTFMIILPVVFCALSLWTKVH